MESCFWLKKFYLQQKHYAQHKKPEWDVFIIQSLVNAFLSKISEKLKKKKLRGRINKAC